MKYWLKKCPRCKGDLREENTNMVGTYIACLQCGHTLTELQEAALEASRSVNHPVSLEEEPQHGRPAHRRRVA